MEKTLEDLMDNDWREFRARLVLKEMREAERDESAASSGLDSSGVGAGVQTRSWKAARNRKTNIFASDGSGDDDNDDDKNKMEKQDKLGNLFVALLNTLFAVPKTVDNDLSSNVLGGGVGAVATEAKSSALTQSVSSPPTSIFDGDAVGGATPSSVLPEGCSTAGTGTGTGKGVVGVGGGGVDDKCLNTDPFASPAEMPLFLSPSEAVKLDKHRWAHPISHIEQGCVLVANERLGGVFHQTVVLVIDHCELIGSTGIVINRPMPGKLTKVTSEYPSNVDLSLRLAFNNAAVTYGGPVMQEEYSILHSYGEVEGSKKVAPGVFVGGSEELMNEVRRNNFRPENALFVRGHAAWVPGQLTREATKGVWYPASVSTDFILRYAGAPVFEGDNRDDLWSDILTCMGGRYAEIAKKHAGRGDNRMMP